MFHTTKLANAIALLTLLAFGPGWSGALRAAPAPDRESEPSAADVQRAEKSIRQKFAPLKEDFAPPLVRITDKSLTETFPGDLFFAAVFRQYPVARLSPPPLQAQNLFVVNRQGKIRHITKTTQLVKFFNSSVYGVKSDGAARAAVRSWLHLSEVLKQDGFYKFAVLGDGVSVTGQEGRRKATGKAEVKSGGKGAFKVSMSFTKEGRIAAIAESSVIHQGVRPICQATKLLDRDPIVRRMAEQDILVMGRACKGYLDEQRARASPELKKAIDRMWRRILDEGW